MVYIRRTRRECMKCTKKIAKTSPLLSCYICEHNYHPKCNNLTRSDALCITSNNMPWMCKVCVCEIFPFGNIPQPKSTISSIENSEPNKKCNACRKTLGPMISKCIWCTMACHTTCIKGDLGCLTCVADLIPGYTCSNKDLTGTLFANNSLFNPFSPHSNSNQIGEPLDNLIEAEAWQHASECLIKCEYTSLNAIKPTKNSELKVLSLNIRSMNKNIADIRDEIDHYSKFDIICFNETSCIPEKLPGGTDDLLIDGFHPPIVQAPARKSGRGGGLITYVNSDVCNVNEYEIVDQLSTNVDPEEGEFLFIKIINCKRLPKTVIIGNMYRSPSVSPSNFISNLKHKLLKLNKQQNKLIIIGGDTNIDLIQHDIDIHAQELTETLSAGGYMPLISRPTRITDHSATLIDHIYTNTLNSVTSSGILTVDLSDHLGTYANFLLKDPHFNQQPTNFAKKTQSTGEYRKFTNENLDKFRELISNESWTSVETALGAQAKYDTFIDTYNKHYNTAFPLMASADRKKQRADPKPWILGLRKPVLGKIVAITCL